MLSYTNLAFMDVAIDQNIILINKSYGWTSYDVVRYLKKNKKFKKIGHAGTLDPMATGLLIILTNEYTKKFSEFQNFPKTYEAEITFGQKTDTYDGDGAVIYTHPSPFLITTYKIENILTNFLGTIEQRPPIYSAVHVAGKRAHHLARKGEDIILPSKKVTIYSARILSVVENKVSIEFCVSSGTYIRSIAYDMGELLGVGAFLSKLHRTKIGEYTIQDAFSISKT